MNYLFLEAESFRELGGWVIDPSSMHQMGSSYLMAHGAGVPVADAETEIEISEPGVYHIWARTRDWTAVWKRGTSAGRFTLWIDGVELPQILGTNQEQWSWQKVGSAALESGTHKIALHDLTGFNGRCDAIYFSTDPGDVPPDGGAELEKFRRNKTGVEISDEPEIFDLIVAGGGVAGTVTALAAARLGLKSILLQDKSVLGGCCSSEIRVPLGGCTHIGPYPQLGNTVREIAPLALRPGAKPAEWYEDLRKANAFLVECPGKAELRLNERVTGILTEGDAVTAVQTQKETIPCNAVIVATGGLSYPSTGSTGDGYAFAKEFGHSVVKPVPSLAQLVTVEDVSALKGLSLRNVTLSAYSPDGKKLASEFGEMLFTDKGLSGPVALSVSARVNRASGVTLSLDLKPALSREKLEARMLRDFSERTNAYVGNAMRALLPARLDLFVLKKAGISPAKKVNSVTREERGRIVDTLGNLRFGLHCVAPFEEAVVTSGGVELKELTPACGSRIKDGLYFAGEVVDVDALTGGYNMQIAFSTAAAVARNILKREGRDSACAR